METHRRGADGRRRFSADFKQAQLARLARQDVTFAELSQELDISQSVLRRWTHLSDRAATQQSPQTIMLFRRLNSSRRSFAFESWSVRWAGRPWRWRYSRQLGTK